MKDIAKAFAISVVSMAGTIIGFVGACSVVEKLSKRTSKN